MIRFKHLDVNLGNSNKQCITEEIVNTKINEALSELNIYPSDIITIKMDKYQHISDRHVEINIFYRVCETECVCEPEEEDFIDERHVGSNFDDFLKEEEIYEDCVRNAKETVEKYRKGYTAHITTKHTEHAENVVRTSIENGRFVIQYSDGRVRQIPLDKVIEVVEDKF